MQIPFAILKSAGGSKGAFVLALLAGMCIVAAMKQHQRNALSPPGR